MPVNLTGTLAAFVTAHNNLDSNFGVLNGNFSNLESDLGDIADSNAPSLLELDSAGNPVPLTTSAQTITGAINEIDSDFGDVATLTTTSKTLVGAINELDSDIANLTLDVGGTAANDLLFQDNTELVFGTDSDARLYVDGSHLYLDLQSGIGNFYIRDGSTTRYTFDDNGDFTATGNVTAYSDERLKEEIETIKNALSIVESMRGVYYTKNGRRETGVIAQEVQQMLPEVIKDDGEYLSVAYGNMMGLMIEAIKELNDRIKEIERRFE